MIELAAKKAEFFNTRNYFILAAIGSAVGLGNIWRFPYVAFKNGGGAFILPYLAALLLAGIPILFFDYAIGNRYRGSAPLALRRLGNWTESLGWWQVMVAFIIGIYYAAVVAWAAMYTWYSLTTAWGDDPGTFLMVDVLHVAEKPGIGFDFVPGVIIPIILVWVVTLVIIGLGVNKGLAWANLIFMPLLLVMFLTLVVYSVFLPGAMEGLNALFAPDWSALAKPDVWAAAVGQIFFSLSVGFGIMITYSSYLKRKTDLTGSGLVVGFANSSFELLAGIGVFAALGFMAHQAGTDVNSVAGGGIGLAFVAFPSIISQASWGPLLGVLFFGSLTVAGLTSLMSVIEVVIAGFRDKLGLDRVTATIGVGVPMAIISVCMLGTTTGLYFLDITDEFNNKFGILAGAFACIVSVAWIVKKLPVLQRHLDQHSSFKAGKIWLWSVGALVPVALGYLLITSVIGNLQKPYEGYPAWMLNTFGWGMSGTLIVVAVIIKFLPWRKGTKVDFDENANEHEGQVTA